MQPLRVDLPAHLRQGRAVGRGREAVRAGRGRRAGACSTGRRPSRRRGPRGRRPPCRAAARRTPPRMRGRPARAGSKAGSCRQTPACGSPRPVLIASTAATWASIRRLRDAPEVAGVAHARREPALAVAHQRDDLRLVDRARERHQVAERGRDALDVAREALDGVGRQPAAALGEPARQREVMQRHERGQPVLLERRRARAGSARAPPRCTRPGRARSATTRATAGARSGRGRPAGRSRPRSGATGRSRRPRARRTSCRARAPTPTSRC